MFFKIALERIVTALAVKCIRLLAGMAINKLTENQAEGTIDSLAGNGLKIIDDIKRKRV